MINCAVLSSVFFLHRVLNPEHDHSAGQVSMLTQCTCTRLTGKHRAAADGAAGRGGRGGLNMGQPQKAAIGLISSWGRPSPRPRPWWRPHSHESAH